jgi:hypothetical protein
MSDRWNPMPHEDRREGSRGETVENLLLLREVTDQDESMRAEIHWWCIGELTES